MMTGKFFLILGPSGSGKGTVLSLLKRHYPQFVFPISCTTRPKRPQEKEGEIYHFITQAEFERRIESGEFLEHAIVHQNHYYGTLKQPILSALNEGKVVIRELDVQGLRSIRRVILKSRLVSIFLTVPNWDTLQQRILKRSDMSIEEIERRQHSYLEEMKWEKECDYVVQSYDGQTEELFRAVEKIILENLPQSR